jgi:gamma-glutamyltranspeptidase/glutathione hydrolase
MAPGTGVILNNEMDDFSANPGTPNAYGLVGSEANSVQPGKRPLSSMTPTIVLKNGVPILSIGGAGGSRILTAVMQGVLRTLAVRPGDLRDGIFGPRLHHQWLPDALDAESSFPAEVLSELKSMGHTMGEVQWTAEMHGVYRNEQGSLISVHDPRTMGGAAAF